MTTRVAIYTRVSTEDQAQEGFSLEAQKDQLTGYCQTHGYTVAGIYSDEGLSGKNTLRPQLQALLKDAERRRFDVVLVWDISRISRNMLDLLTISQHFEKHNISLKSYSEPTEFDTDVGKFSMQLHGAFAELLRKKIISTVHLGMNRRAKEGKWNGGRILGYDIVNKELVINSDEAAIIKMIFDLYVGGQGCIYIRDKLNSLNMKTKNGKSFTHIAILTILENPTYKGFIRYGKTKFHEVKNKREVQKEYILVKGIHKPIISEEIFNKAQDILQSNRRPTRRMPSNPHLLSGILKCPNCGGRMNFQPAGNRNLLNHGGYYTCSNYKNFRTCSSKLYRAKHLENYVLQRIKTIILNPQIIEDVVSEMNSNHSIDSTVIKKQLMDVDKHIQKYEQRKDIIRKQFISGDITIEEHREFKSELDKALAELHTNKDTLALEYAKACNTALNTSDVLFIIKNFDVLMNKADVQMKKHLVESLIERVEMNSDLTIKEIVFNFEVPNPYHQNNQKKNDILTCDTVPPD